MWRLVLIMLNIAMSLFGYQTVFISIFPSLPKLTLENNMLPTKSVAESASIQDVSPPVPYHLNLSDYIDNNSTLSFKIWVSQQGYHLNPQVLESIETILNYVNTTQIEHNNILTLIDYSLPASQKRLWVFDLDAHRVLFHTYVSHGLKSGRLESRFFSNRFDSKASSIGVYRTNKTYYGRHGLSLRLDGLDRGFNDNADSRTIVMHGGWYVEESFIQKYGRAGRSWGCPAVPKQLTADIINTIRDKSLLIIYYPSAEWFGKSRFLQRDDELPSKFMTSFIYTPRVEIEKREDVLLAHITKNHNHSETEAILAMPADRYAHLFQTAPPLERMLRRQVENEEYIALSKTEFDRLLSLYPQNNQTFQDLHLILPEIKMIRGYYATEMRKINYGTITEVQASPPQIPITECNAYTLYFSNHSALFLKPTNRFIRWLGL